MSDKTYTNDEIKRTFSSGATSTKQPRLSLIPHKGLVNAAVQFEIGEIKHEGTCYNAGSNTHYLQDVHWLIERCSHAAEHCFKMIDYLRNVDYGESLDEVIRDAGAVAWCGLTLGQALIEIMENARVQKEDSLQAGTTSASAAEFNLQQRKFQGLQGMCTEKEKQVGQGTQGGEKVRNAKRPVEDIVRDLLERE